MRRHFRRTCRSTNPGASTSGTTRATLSPDVQFPALADYRGEHVATLITDSFDALPVSTAPPRPRRDFVADAPPQFGGARLLLYLNGAEPSFQCNPQPQGIVELTRESLGGGPL